MASGISSGNIMKKDQEKQIVLVGGCFDVIHFGHVNFLTEARKLGGYLIVALESDENVRKSKGDNRPIHSQHQREAMLRALSCVDKVISLPPMESDAQYNEFVRSVHPNIIAITQGDPIKKKKELQAHRINAALVEIPKIHTPSTSQLAKLLGVE
jgi:rfaE bifunctional protein nucleotidyltransferase chain/domain